MLFQLLNIMKKLILLLIFFCNSVYSQAISSNQTSESKIDFLKSYNNDLKDENGNNIFNSSDLDTIILAGEASGNRFGISVATAGDVNGDGYSDAIVGANGNSRAYIYFGGPLVDNTADIILIGESSSDLFGVSVSTAGDVNGDGFTDVIVGANGYNNYTGRSYIYFGGSNMNNIADVIMTGELTSNYYGWTVSSAGDVNGDGYSDVIVGAPLYNSFVGCGYIYFGGTSMNNVADVLMTGEVSNSKFGTSVSKAGDVNGDGFSDIIVGAENYDNSTGIAYICFGGSPMNNAADVVLHGEAVNNKFGISVSSAGDVNNDGYSDVIVGAHQFNNSIGRAYIYCGGSSMNNVPDVFLSGENVNDNFGYSVCGIGDINADGHSDVIVGAYGYFSNYGRAYIYCGGSNINNEAVIKITGQGSNYYFGGCVSSAGDLNSDGYSDVICGVQGFSNNTGQAYIFTNLMPAPKLFYPINESINNSTIINFRWDKVSNTANYILSITTDSLFNNIIENDTLFSDTNKVVSGLQKNTKYFWKVKAKDTSGIISNSSIWNFTTIPPIYTNIKLLFEGMYSPVFNQLSRKDSVKVYLRNVTSPYELVDSAKNAIDSLSYSGLFNFVNASSGSYFLIVKHFNSIETWSKSGGEQLFSDGIVYNYDFSTASIQAFGNNLKLKGSKYCIYSGDVNQDGFIDLIDVVTIYNDAANFVAGSNLTTDLTGDNIVDLSDVTLCYNNSSNFIRIRKP